MKGKEEKIVCKSERLVSLSYLEVEDDCPNEAEGELGVAVHNVLPPDVDQLDLLVPRGQIFVRNSETFVRANGQT